LSRPGGNITGLSEPASELDVLKEAVPRATRIGVLWNPTTPSQVPAAAPARPHIGSFRGFSHFDPERSSEAFTRLAYPALVTDHAMEA
jgi:hypothetical protein